MRLFATLFIFVHATLTAQVPILEIKPTTIKPLDLSNEAAAKYERDFKIFISASEKLAAGTKQDDLSPEELSAWNAVDETREDYWDIIGGGCSWYCAGGPKNVTASSALKPQGANSYSASNAHDLSYKSAWVEGVDGYGKGEFLTYEFSPESPRITEIIVVNGYAKTERAYLDNSRAKKLKMYLNDRPFAVLHLEDSRSEQFFKFEPIGNSNREDLESLKLQPGWTLKFEIMEVYEGLKFADVAITEIYFDGVDVH